MDWKILVIVVVVLSGFFIFKTCNESDTPNFDENRQLEEQSLKQSNNRKERLEREESRKRTAEEIRSITPRSEEKTADLETDEFHAVFSTRLGSLKNFTLKNPQYVEPPRDWSTGLRQEDIPEKDYTPVDIVTTNTTAHEELSSLQFVAYDGLDALLKDADYELVEKSAKHVLFKYSQAKLPVIIYKKFELAPQGQPYQFWLTVRVVNVSDQKVVYRGGIQQFGYQHETETGGSMFSKQPNLLNGICRYSDTVYRETWKNIEQPFTGVGTVDFAGLETNYFISTMVPGENTPVTCQINAEIGYWGAKGTAPQEYGVANASLGFTETTLAPGGSQTYRIKNYMGPKTFRLLRATGHSLEESVDFGWFWPISRVLLWLLLKFQTFFINWGVAIILLTVLVKVTLMPLTHKSFQSAERMRALKPEVDKLGEQFKDDPQGKQQATMALYKTKGVNPFGGCLPTLLQMPIWIALYRTLRASPELYRAEFFGWITDLSNPDPYFVTPVVMGIAMFFQQRMTPMTGDNAQAKMMMYFMPIMFTGMMLFLPSGLTLYIFVNTVLSIGHQLLIHRSRVKTTPQTVGGAKKKAAK